MNEKYGLLQDRECNILMGDLLGPPKEAIFNEINQWDDHFLGRK